MKRYFIALMSLIIASVTPSQASQNLWSIGQKDESTKGFALAPDGFSRFVFEDFGWEDRFYLVGYSNMETDFPYVLPSIYDEWAGSTYLGGYHSYVLNIFFDVTDKGKDGEWTLNVHFCDTHPVFPPLFKVTVNGHEYKAVLPAGGSDDSLIGDFSGSRNHTLTVNVPSEYINNGHNQVSLTSLEGSWAIFDAIDMTAPDGAAINTQFSKAYVKNVGMADYLIDDGKSAALIVDVEHLDGKPELAVIVDGNSVFSKVLEKGSYSLEVPVSAVNRTTVSRYQVLLDGQIIRSGKIKRSKTTKTVTPADYVDTGMGTSHSRWMLAPGPWMPFSMVKLSPDNQSERWQAGYDNVFESVGTFSHIHEWTMAGLGTMPVTGPLKTRIGDPSEITGHADGYRSYIDKNTEVCQAGYYAVKLTDYDIYAELTATDRCSFQRYTYPSGQNPRVMVDLRVPAEYGYDIKECRIKQTGPRRIEGYSRQESRNVWFSYADQCYTVYFVMEFDRDIQRFGGWENDSIWENNLDGPSFNPSLFGSFVEFASESPDNAVQVRTGISFVDIQGAANNLKTEIAEPFGWSFDAVYQNQKDVWNDLLGRIRVKSDDRMDKTRFYTNLYRSFCRNTFSDCDGRWTTPDDRILTVSEESRVMGCDAFWNSFWNLNQVWNLIAPEWSSMWVKSELEMYDACGFLAKGPAGAKYIPVMVAEHEIPLMVSAYQMGIRDYDCEKAFEAMVKMQTVPGRKVGRGYAGNRDLEAYMKYHYVPYDKGRFSNTLEYSYDDWTVSQMALALGRQAEYELFAERGGWWRNAIDTVSGYARMRDSEGNFVIPFDPFKSGANEHYVEGNAWQLTEFVPQDLGGLAELIGNERLYRRLLWGFQESDKTRYNAPGEGYWDFPVVQGNQQSMHFAYIFNYLGYPWETQRWSRSVLQRYYGYGRSNAWLGDEDQGQMSAWLVMTSLGLFQTDGGCSVNPRYEIASPYFEEIEIDLGNRYGRSDVFTIKAKWASRLNQYVQSATLNGRTLSSPFFDARELLGGGELRLEMGTDPDKNWGTVAD